MTATTAADPFGDPPPIIGKPPACTVIVGARGQYEAIVNEEDYAFVIRWRWTFKISRGGNVYARRGGGRNRKTGVLNPTILLHDVIMERKGEPRPTPEHTAHHKNHKPLDCTRENLEWQDKSGQEKYKRKRG